MLRLQFPVYYHLGNKAGSENQEYVESHQKSLVASSVHVTPILPSAERSLLRSIEANALPYSSLKSSVHIAVHQSDWLERL